MSHATRILIVDDSVGDRMLLHEAIHDTGWMAEIENVGSARQAILSLSRAALIQTPPDLILTDFLLPGESCLDFIRSVRSMPGYETIPIIVMSTTRPPEQNRAQCHELGVLKVLLKAYDYQSLLKMVTTLRRMLMGKGDISRGGSWISDADLALLGDEN